MKATTILKRIILKGGVIGSAGKLYISNEILAGQFVIECSMQLHTETMKTLLGKDLVEQIEAYRNSLVPSRQKVM
jgi:hypothetical protein